MNSDPAISILSHHALALAIPALLPAVVVSGVVVYLAVRDRRTADTDAESTKGDDL